MQPAGLVCPRCNHTAFRTSHVYRQTGVVRRRRVCLNPACRRPLYTFEVPAACLCRKPPQGNK